MSTRQRFPAELYVEFISHATPSTAAAIALTARQFQALVAPLLYRDVVLTFTAARLFFRTLRLNPELGGRVRSLRLLGTRHHEGEDFNAAIECLTDVKALHIMCPVDLDTLLTKFSSILTTFTYGSPITDDLYHFLLQQHYIHHLSIYHPVVRPGLWKRTRATWFLGHLVQVEAHMDDICHLIVGAHVERLKIRYSEPELPQAPYLPMKFIALSSSKLTHLEVSAAQFLDTTRDELTRFLPALRMLILVEDFTWGSREHVSEHFEPRVVDLADKLTALPALRRIAVVTQFGAPQATAFYHALRNHCRAPTSTSLSFTPLRPSAVGPQPRGLTIFGDALGARTPRALTAGSDIKSQESGTQSIHPGQGGLDNVPDPQPGDAVTPPYLFLGISRKPSVGREWHVDVVPVIVPIMPRPLFFLHVFAHPLRWHPPQVPRVLQARPQPTSSSLVPTATPLWPSSLTLLLGILHKPSACHKGGVNLLPRRWCRPRHPDGLLHSPSSLAFPTSPPRATRAASTSFLVVGADRDTPTVFFPQTVVWHPSHPPRVPQAPRQPTSSPFVSTATPLRPFSLNLLLGIPHKPSACRKGGVNVLPRR
ncbi:hypothetical protein B0H16DRAFT_1749443 [Mycena metata]|uniref:Uncharacterized protein n=1 Tax=Mycena metata TaxID=1033252 RepID=A0AAD7DTK8_9AGAR|nr:hypothetical protein B0H16DRAFT_1749443 [Mycena metata]